MAYGRYIFTGTSRWLSLADNLLGTGWLFTSIIIYIMWKYLIIQKEDVEKLILKIKYPNGENVSNMVSHQAWFSIKFTHEKVDNKCIVTICVVWFMFGIANKNYGT